ncbi:MAG: hypothetical protein HOO67_01265 [Candidatus Peribacteraceae bacterium]|nr:hypothetical protein [Candidatus Peribacteraceae bacterium]
MPRTRLASEPASIRPLLHRIGLDEKESEIYLALLSLKVARASSVAKVARQSRSHTYLILRTLVEKGLVSEIERGKVIHFVAEPPQRLLGYLDDRKQQLEELRPLVEGALPFFSAITSQFVGQPRVTFLRGIDGMKQVYRDMLKKDFCALFNPEAMYEAFGGNVVTQVYGKYAELHGRDLLVDSPSAKQYMKELKQGDAYQIRLLPKSVTFGTDTIVTSDTVALFAYDLDRTIVRIENANIAASFRAWFEVLWARSSPSGDRK